MKESRNIAFSDFYRKSTYVYDFHTYYEYENIHSIRETRVKKIIKFQIAGGNDFPE